MAFLDCTCLDALVAAHTRLLAARGTLVLSGVTPRMLRLLRLTGLDQVLLTTSLSDVDSHPDRLGEPSRSAAV